MSNLNLREEAERHLKYLAEKIPTRRVGSTGNRLATDFFDKTIASFGFTTECPRFECMDWTQDGAHLTVEGRSFQARVSPYSRGCSVDAPLETASSVEELKAVAASGKILLLHGKIANEPLMPKNFRFYNPDEHRQIYALLESKNPLAIITATGRNPEMAGAVYPFPMIEDGDFDIPSVYITEEEGSELAKQRGKATSLEIRSQRIPSHGFNVIARKKGTSGKRIVVLAHIDSKDGTPGALDNAGGITILLLLAELLQEHRGKHEVEIVALNGEDYYSNPGEIQFLETNEGRLGDIVLGINIDGVGYRKGKTAFSLYAAQDELANAIRKVVLRNDDLTEGTPWYQGDHMLFVLSQVPALAWTSEESAELMSSIVHTEKDTPEMIDFDKLAGTAAAIHDLIAALD